MTIIIYNINYIRHGPRHRVGKIIWVDIAHPEFPSLEIVWLRTAHPKLSAKTVGYYDN